MGEDVIGGRCPSWQAMVSVKNFHRSARARPPPADTQDESSAVTTSQVTPSTQDFAVSLLGAPACCCATSATRQAQVLATDIRCAPCGQPAGDPGTAAVDREDFVLAGVNLD
jgi:hypothetical protein